MNETFQQYSERILRYSEGQDPLKVQAATAKKLSKLVKGISRAKLRRRPAPEKWSIAEILAHLADVEIVLGWRMRSILGTPGVAIQAFDQNAWVVALHYEKRDPRESIALLQTLRDANLKMLKRLKPEQWKQFGIHSERGRERIEHLVSLMAGHDLNHIEQIEKILAPKKK